jgi:GT2 family glycosyltransferase
VADNFFVTAVIVSHDGATWLTESIAALFSQTRAVDRIIAVDTDSHDNSVKLLVNSGINVLQAPRDTGFGDAINMALESTPTIADAENELLWILHDDCAPTRNALAKLIEGIADQPQVAFVGPKLRGWYDRSHLLEVGISIAGNGARWTGLERREYDQGQHDAPRQVLAVSTAAMLARRDVFEELGGLDPNLALFRDDVDLGWRARVAGFTVKCIPEALVFHVEASANERRPIDVSEAFLHRPLLLDRRNAAYVLLANASFWQTPWIALQLLSSAIVRAVGFLLAKLPGYAADEIGAVGLLLIKPADIFLARRLRKSRRLLSSSVIKPFIPPRLSQIRTSWERLTDAISQFVHPLDEGEMDEEVSGAGSYSDIGLIPENFDDLELDTVSKRSRWKSLANRPLLVALTSTLLISLIASRSRYGSLSGGALALAPNGAQDLFAQFAESWHAVGMGSAAPTPPWIPLLGLFSFITFGSVPLFLTLLFLLTPPLAFFVAYRAMKRTGLTPLVSVLGGVIYAFSPVIWNSINQGRLGTIAIALLTPTFISFAPIRAINESASWRKIYSLALLSTVLAAFCAPFLLLYTLGVFGILVIRLVTRRAQVSESGVVKFLLLADLAVEKRLLASTLIPWILNAPWSVSLLVHPTQILQDPGFPLRNTASAWHIFLFNVGGATGVPWWVISPFIIFAFVVLLHPLTRNQGLLAWAIFAGAVALSTTHISGHGSVGTFWTGSFIVWAEIILLAPALKILADVIPNLRGSSLGLGHFVTALSVLIALTSVALTGIWSITTGSHSLVSGTNAQVMPPFVASLATTDARPKTLVIRQDGATLNYYVSRGTDLGLGNPDVVVPMPPALEEAIVGALGGTALTSSRIIGGYGIKYLFVKNPADPNLVRTIDGIGGFTRSSATSSGIIWRVLAANPRVSMIAPDGKISTVPSGPIGSLGTVTTTGKISLGEKFDSGWKLLLNGQPTVISQNVNGVPQFLLNQTGTINLLHDGTKRRAVVSLELIALLTVIVLSLPAGRRRSEVPIEELV